MTKRYSLKTKKVLPFLKWAGGKRWLMANYADRFPTNYNRYIEPFVGSGAVFFTLNPDNAILSDANSWLIDTYLALQKDWERVVNTLHKHQKNHSSEYYYKIRAQKTNNIYTSAAKFIYLNRTCWNGLFRVNKKGQFNVPIGTKTNVLLESDNFEEVSRRLSNATIVNLDFEKVIDQAEANDLVFVDPPYTVKHDNNGFIKYNEVLFHWDDQERLKDALLRAKRRGVQIVSTNAHHESILELYRDDFIVETVQRASVISGSAKARGSCQEYLIIG